LNRRSRQPIYFIDSKIMCIRIKSKEWLTNSCLRVHWRWLIAEGMAPCS
jgi:hypothetical protein